MKMENLFSLVVVIMLFICSLFPVTIQAAELKVLVVMSYEQDNLWCMEIKEGIDSALGDTSEITYFYMDTKINLEGGEQKANQAYTLFQKIKPDGVIAVDDNAQRLFVLPYLKNKFNTPVMFCGVNNDAEQYGYPASNVSGILERGHIRESIAFARQLVPSIRIVAFLAKESPSGRALLKQVENESNTYLAKKTTFNLVKNINELVALGKELKKQSDAIYIDSLEGIQDKMGNPTPHKDAIRILTSLYDKPIIGANQYHVKQGALCAVTKTGQEQGETAAKMLLKAMRGTPVFEIPVTRNYKGKRIMNVTTMKTLGIKPRPIALLGVKLVKTEK